MKAHYDKIKVNHTSREVLTSLLSVFNCFLSTILQGISVELVNLCDEKHLSAQDMQAKMISALKDVQTRLYELQETTQNVSVASLSHKYLA